MKGKEPKFNFDDLESEAKAYVEMRVRRLGSVEMVKAVYKRPDLVARYAWHYAEQVFGAAPERPVFKRIEF